MKLRAWPRVLLLILERNIFHLMFLWGLKKVKTDTFPPSLENKLQTETACGAVRILQTWGTTSTWKVSLKETNSKIKGQTSLNLNPILNLLMNPSRKTFSVWVFLTSSFRRRLFYKVHRHTEQRADWLLPVERKRCVAKRSWGEIFTFISFSDSLKMEKSWCFRSWWETRRFVRLSADRADAHTSEHKMRAFKSAASCSLSCVFVRIHTVEVGLIQDLGLYYFLNDVLQGDDAHHLVERVAFSFVVHSLHDGEVGLSCTRRSHHNHFYN